MDKKNNKLNTYFSKDINMSYNLLNKNETDYKKYITDELINKMEKYLIYDLMLYNEVISRRNIIIKKK